MRHGSERKARPPLDDEALQRLALHYAGRYATTRAKLGAYLSRKLRERGWAGEGGVEGVVTRLVSRFQELGYVDDEAFADARAASLGRRGYGERRVAQALKAAGIDEADADGARTIARESAWASALRFAARKRVGPFAAHELDRETRQKAFAAMMRAGHPPEIAGKLLAMSPGTPVDPDEPFFT